MGRQRLNTDSVRKWVIDGGLLREERFRALATSALNSRISRRRLLQGVAFAAPTGVTLSNWDRSRLTVDGDERRIAFRVDGVERWVLDPARFSGRPRLAVQRRPERVQVALIDAKFPGTHIPADLECCVEFDGRVWMLELSLKWGRVQSTVAAIPWLLEQAPLQAAWQGRPTQIDFGDLALRFGGTGRADFRPGWQFAVAGDSVARITTAAKPIVSDGFVIGLDPDGAPPVYMARTARRAVVHVDLREHPWTADSISASLATAGLDAARFPFQSARAQVGTDDHARDHGALVFQQEQPGDSLRFVPGGSLRADDGGPFSVALANARLAITKDARHSRRALIAELDPSTTAFAPGVRVEFGTTPDTPQFELHAHGDDIREVIFEPSVLGLSAPVADAVTDNCGISPQLDPMCERKSVERRSYQWWRGLIPPFRPWRNRPHFIGDTPQGSPGFPVTQVDVRRPEDLLVLSFKFEGLFLKSRFGKAPVLRTAAGTVGRITVTFPPQNIAEETWPLSSVSPAPTPPARAILAGSTRLVFNVAPGTEVEYSLSGLLGWSGIEPSLVPYARKPGEGGPYTNTIRSPLATETTIEYPYRLHLSPHADSAWAHATEPVCDGHGRIELWHTRLGARASDGSVDEHNDAARTLRATWSPDYVPPPAGGDATIPADASPFPMSVLTGDRHQIVRSTSDYTIDSDTARRSAPIGAKQFMLSALGAWVDMRGTWEPPNARNLVLEDYIHRGTAARDNFVRVVQKGFLFPIGHQASLIRETERRIERVAGKPVALLRTREYIKIRQREKNYPALGQPFAGRDCVFSRIVFSERDVVTPDLDPKVLIGGCADVFWPTVNTKEFRFRFIVIDGNGHETQLEAPLIFIRGDSVFPSGAAAAIGPCVNAVFNEYQTKRPLRVLDARGQVIACAPSTTPGQTDFPTNEIVLTAQAPTRELAPGVFSEANQPPFYPRIEQLTSCIPALAQLTGNNRPVRWQLSPTFVEHGFDPTMNCGEVYGELLDNLELVLGGTPSGASAPQNTGDRAGGLATPSAKIVGLSRRLGPVGGTTTGAGRVVAPAPAIGAAPVLSAPTGGLSKIQDGKFDPSDFFGAFLDAKLLGVVRLSDVIGALGVGDNLGEAPKLIRNATYSAAAAIKGATKELTPRLRELPPDILNRFAGMTSELERLANLPGTDAENLAHAAAIIQTGIRLAEEVNKILANPSVLLPAGFVQFRDLVLDPASGLQAQLLVLLGSKATHDALKQAVDAYVADLTNTLEQTAFADSIRGGLAELDQLNIDLDAAIAEAALELAAAQNAADAVRKWIALIGRISLDSDATLTLATMFLDAAGVGVPDVAAARTQLGQALAAFIAPAVVPLQARLAEVEGIRELARTFPDRVAAEVADEALNALRRLKSIDTKVEAAARQERLSAERQLANATRRLRQLVPAGTTIGNPAQPLEAVLVTIVRDHTQIRNLAAAGAAVTSQRIDAITATLTGRLQAEVVRRAQAVLTSIPASTANDFFDAAVTVLDAIAEVEERASWLLHLGNQLEAAVRQRLQAGQRLIVNARNAYRAEFQKTAATVRERVTQIEQAVPNELKPLVSGAIGVLVAELNSYATAAKGPEQIGSFGDALERARQELLQAVSDPLRFVIDLGALRQQLDAFLAQYGIPDAIDLEYTWIPRLQNVPRSNPLFEAGIGDAKAALNVTAKSHVSLRGQAPEFSVDARLTNFTIHLIPDFKMLHLKFNAVNFISKPGSGTHVDVDLQEAEFGEALSFVKELQKFLNPSTGPYLDIKPTGIVAGFRLALPTIPLGPVIIYNLTIGTSIELSFIGKPLVIGFNLGTRRNPVVIVLGFMGGSAYFGLTLTADGLQSLEAAIEAGAMAQLDLAGLARGSGYVFVGLFYRLEKVGTHNRTKLCGYVRAGGELTIIGMISVSLELYCGICWQTPNRVTGTASLTVEIHLFLFEVSVNISVTYTFCGDESSSDQTALISSSAPAAKYETEYDWSLYQSAFED